MTVERRNLSNFSSCIYWGRHLCVFTFFLPPFRNNEATNMTPRFIFNRETDNISLNKSKNKAKINQFQNFFEQMLKWITSFKFKLNLSQQNAICPDQWNLSYIKAFFVDNFLIGEIIHRQIRMRISQEWRGEKKKTHVNFIIQTHKKSCSNDFFVSNVFTPRNL